jgi:hypothetical protein
MFFVLLDFSGLLDFFMIARADENVRDVLV